MGENHMIKQELFNDGQRKWVYFGRDPDRPESVIDTNEYLVVHEGRGMLLDPGGLEIFPAVTTMITGEIEVNAIDVIFASHQDPDICSSLSLWVGLLDQVTVYTPWVWTTFISHYGTGGNELTGIPDEGFNLPLGDNEEIRLIPAHYCHSSGNFSVYDPRAKILWTGDIGAALLPRDHDDPFVRDFDEHIQYMEGFHRRWMPSNSAKNEWVAHVRELDVELMCPQHGAMFRGEDVTRFLDWFEALQVGQTKRGSEGARRRAG